MQSQSSAQKISSLGSADIDRTGNHNLLAQGAVNLKFDAEEALEYQYRLSDAIMIGGDQDIEKHSRFTRIMRRLEQSRIKPLAFFDFGYAAIRFDYLDYGYYFRGIMNMRIGVKLKTDSNPIPFLQFNYKDEKCDSIIRRSLFYYDGYSYEYYYYRENRNSFDNFYSLTAGWAF
jgi:hypothetical protein